MDVASVHTAAAPIVNTISHEPAGYRCPFCAIAAGAEAEFTAYRDEHVVVQISLHWNPVHPGRRW